MNKFFALLIQNSIPELIQAAIESDKDHAGIQASQNLLRMMCERIKIPFPEEPLKAKYDTLRDHMESRAALVLEEARYSLCQDLYDLRLNNAKPAFEIEMEVVKEEVTEEEAPKKPRQVDSPVSFQRTVYEKGWFTRRELRLLMTGLIVQCVPDRGAPDGGMKDILGVVSSSNSSSAMAQHGILDIQFFNPSLLLPPGSRWKFYPVGTSHINGARQFEAVSSYESLVPFFEVIRGAEVPGDRGLSAALEIPDATETQARVKTDQLHVPILNESQQKAASTFLGSQDGTVTIVQGYVMCLQVCVYSMVHYRVAISQILQTTGNRQDNLLRRHNLSVFATGIPQRAKTPDPCVCPYQ